MYLVQLLPKITFCKIWTTNWKKEDQLQHVYNTHCILSSDVRNTDRQRERESQDSTYPRHRQQQLACDLTLQCHISVILTNTHKHTFNGPLPGTIRVSRYQKGKPVWILMKQETVSGSGISWAICKSAPRSRQITTPAPHHSVFYRPDALPTASKHSRHTNHQCISN